MLRFLCICIIVIGFLIVMIPLLIAEWILGKFAPLKKDLSSLRIVQAAFRLIVWIAGVKVTVLGEEHVPKDTAVLYAANHRGCFDILLTYIRCRNRTGFIAKKELERYPLLSVWMRYLHCLFLDRQNLRNGVKTILEAAEKVTSGISIFIFPEGTRSKSESELEMLPFHDGSFKIASKANCPVIPVAISNTASLFEDHFPIVRPGHVIIRYGEPVYLNELEKEQKKYPGAYVQNIILEMLKKNQELL